MTNRSAAGTKKRFLVAEDEFTIALMLENEIEELGHTVVAAVSCCAQALDVINWHHLDGIILDVHLTGGTSEEIVVVSNTRKIRILISTGSDPASLPAAYGDLPVLKKPWTSREFADAVKMLLEIEIK